MGKLADAWDPAQYERFKAERTAPFRDLLELIRPVPGGRVVDLGCGTGELTAEVHASLGARQTVGIDNSEAMLERARGFDARGLAFRLDDISMFGASDGPVDVVFSNAALQWLGDHRSVLARWSSALGAGGQLAVQAPANVDHPSHTTAVDVAGEEPFASAIDPAVIEDPVRSVLPPEAYAELLDQLGFDEQRVRLQVYGHRLASTGDVVEWVKGTSLTRFRRAMPDDLFASFLDRYRTRLIERLGDKSPYFYAFKRVLFWGTRP